MRLLLLLLLLCPLYGQGQSNAAMVKGEPYARILKFSHLSLIDPLPSLQFAYEWQFADQMSMQHEAGYIMQVFDQYHLDRPRGLRLRNEFRYYLNTPQGRAEGFYAAPELLFVHLRSDRNDNFGMDCVDFNCNYFQNVEYIVQKQVYALHVKVGFQELIGKRFVFDVYGGYGWRHVVVKDLGKPEDLGWRDDFGWDFRKRAGIHNLPSVSLGFKLGYTIFYKERSFLLKYDY